MGWSGLPALSGRPWFWAAVVGVLFGNTNLAIVVAGPLFNFAFAVLGADLVHHCLMNVRIGGFFEHKCRRQRDPPAGALTTIEKHVCIPFSLNHLHSDTEGV